MDTEKNYRLDGIAANILLTHDEETGEWLAHCLELDVMEQGQTPVEALKNLVEMMGRHLEDAFKEGEDFIQLAPQEYWKKYQEAVPFSYENLNTTSYFPPNFIIRQVPPRHATS